MKKLLLLMLFVLCLDGVGSGIAQAQTVLSVPFSSGSFAWDAPVVNSTYSAPTQYVITCGAIVANIPAPATSVSIRSVVPGPGTYDCTIYAQNSYGRSAGPDPAFPRFDAGNPPGAATNLRLVVTP